MVRLVSYGRQAARWWFFVLIFSVPLMLKYVTKDPFAISYLNLFSVGFIGLGIVNGLTGGVPFRPISHRPFAWLIVAVFAAMAWGLLFTDPVRNGVGLWTSRLAQPFLVGYFGYLLLENRTVKSREVIIALAASLLPLLLIGLMQFLEITPYRDPGRVTATYFYPNTFARYVDIILLAALPWIAFRADRKRLWLGVWGLGVTLLLFTQSYNGVASLFVGLVVFFLLLPQPFRAFKKIGLVFLVVTTVAIVANARFLPKYETSITDSRLTRLEFWRVATGVIGDHFWTGIGIKTWEKQYPALVEKYFVQPTQTLPRNWGSVQPHNVFLDSFVKAGWPGFVAISWLLIWPITEGVAFARSYHAKNPDWWIGVSLAAYGAGMLFFGLIDDPIWSDDTMPILFILYFTLAHTAKDGRKTNA